MSEASLNLHGGCILLAEAGILIRGPSGSGKSTLARELIAARQTRGGFAALVADDRVMVSRHGTRLVARPHPAIAGLIEQRGFGLRQLPYEEAAVLRVVADVSTEDWMRFPESEALSTSLLGLRLPRVAGRPDQLAALIEAAISWPG